MCDISARAVSQTMKTPRHKLTMPANPPMRIFSRTKGNDVSFAGSEKSELMITIPPIEPIPKIAM